MFNKIEIKVGKYKCIFTECRYKTYKQIMRDIKMFIAGCLELELELEKNKNQCHK